MDEYHSRMERRRAAEREEAARKSSKSRHTKKGSGGGKKKRGWFKRLLIILLLLILFLILAGIVIVFAIIHSAPALNTTKLNNQISTVLYDQDDKRGTVVDAGVHRLYADIDSIPLSVQDAYISTEDIRFYQHSGIDPIRIGGSVVAQFTHGYKSEGASTIDQQVVRNAQLTQKKMFKRKIQEMYLAVQLDKKYTKKQILEMYLNQIYLGEGPTYGVAAASELYFGKNIKDIDLAQSAMLAAMTRNPGYYNPIKHPARAKQRRDLVLNLMVKYHAITKDQAAVAKKESMEKMTKNHQAVHYSNRKYGAFVEYVRNVLVHQEKLISEKEFDSGGLKIYTTLDPEIQNKVQNILNSKNQYPNVQKNFQAGVSVIDTQTGAIRALGGGRDYHYLMNTNHSYRKVGSVGSTAKPIVDYGPAIEYLKWPTDYQVDDKKGVRYSSLNGNGKIVNDWDGKFMGEMTMRKALYLSRNVPAIETLQQVNQATGGPASVIRFANQLGMNFSRKDFNESYGIGSFYSSPLAMSGAFAAFGNSGIYNQPYAIRKIVKPDGEVITPNRVRHVAMHDYTAFMITDMLKDVMTRGTGISANISGVHLAGKTGTQNIDSDYARQVGLSQYAVNHGAMDEWFVGYTTRLTAAIWTGYDVTRDDIAKKRYLQKSFGTYLSSAEQGYSKSIFKNIMIGFIPGAPDFPRPKSVVSLGDGEYGVVNSSVRNHYSASSAGASSSSAASSSVPYSSTPASSAPASSSSESSSSSSASSTEENSTENSESSSPPTTFSSSSAATQQ